MNYKNALFAFLIFSGMSANIQSTPQFNIGKKAKSIVECLSNHKFICTSLLGSAVASTIVTRVLAQDDDEEYDVNRPALEVINNLKQAIWDVLTDND